jgi:hypothetical protein
MLATVAVLSLICTHIVSWQIDKIEWADNRLFHQIDGTVDPVLTPAASAKAVARKHVFRSSRPSAAVGDEFSLLARLALPALMVGTAVLQFVAVFLPLFTLNYSGIIGIVLDLFVTNGHLRTLSLLSIGTTLSTANLAASPTDAFLFFFFQLAWYFVIVMAPLLQMLLHLALWWMELSVKDARRLLFFAKALGYWASIEVIVLAVIVLPFEISPLIQYIINKITGGQCGAATDFLNSVLDVANCIDVQMSLDWGFAFVFLGVLLQTTLGGVMQRASGVVLRDREEALEGLKRAMYVSPFEWVVMHLLLQGGAMHLKPELHLREWVEFGKSETKKLCCSNPFKGIDSASVIVKRMGPGGQTEYAPTASKWNLPQQQQQQQQQPSQQQKPGKWNAPAAMQGAMTSPPPMANAQGSMWNVAPPRQQPGLAHPVNPPSGTAAPGQQSLGPSRPVKPDRGTIQRMVNSVKGKQPLGGPPPGFEVQSVNPVFQRETATTKDRTRTQSSVDV